MADAVATRVISETDNYYVVHMTNYSDGTGESAALKIDKSTLTTKNSAGAAIEPASLDLIGIRWNVQGFSSVRLMWRHTANHDMMIVSGSGQDVFQLMEGQPLFDAPFGLRDPRTSPGANDGDVLITTTGAAAGNTYDITAYFRKAKA